MSRLIRIVAKTLDLQKPFKIELRSGNHRKGDRTADYIAICKDGGKGKLHSHLIRIWLGDLDRGISATITHELIHAWQEEYHPRSNIHGRLFRAKAKELQTMLKLESIYIKGVDL